MFFRIFFLRGKFRVFIKSGKNVENFSIKKGWFIWKNKLRTGIKILLTSPKTKTVFIHFRKNFFLTVFRNKNRTIFKRRRYSTSVYKYYFPLTINQKYHHYPVDNTGYQINNLKNKSSEKSFSKELTNHNHPHFFS